MTESRKSNSTVAASSNSRGEPASGAPHERSRRAFLKSGAVLAGTGAASQLAAGRAHAQAANAADSVELMALQQRPRRILLRGGTVLTLDRRLGDFAKADVLIEDGKIRE